MLNEICRQIFWTKEPKKRNKRKEKKYVDLESLRQYAEQEREWTKEHIALIKEHFNLRR
jgi:hypothetical protein